MAENTFDFLGQQEKEPLDPPASTSNGGGFMDIFNSLNAQTADVLSGRTERPMSLTERANAPVGPKSMTYVPDAAIDPYRYQEGFQGQYFNPLDTTNYEKWAAKETFSSALSKGFDSFGHKFGNTFVDYWKGYGRMADALVSMDWDKMRPDEAEMAELYYQEQMDMKKNFVFETPEDEDSIFSKRTMSEFIGNAGFALGTFAGLGLEIAADIAITAATGGAGAVSLGATATRLAGKGAAARTGVRALDTVKDFGVGFAYGNKSAQEIAALSKTTAKIAETASVANMTKSAAKASIDETFKILSNNVFDIAKSKNIGQFTENVLKGLPVIGPGARSAEKLMVASKAGANTAQLMGMGAQGLRRVAQELNLSATEASFEAVTTYGDTLDKMVKQYQAENAGNPPDAQEFERMRKLAMNASSSNYNTNLGLLLATNKIQFGNLFNKFIPANKFMSEAAEKLLTVEGKAGSEVLINDGFFGTYGLVGKIARDFGKKEAAYQLSKAFAKDFLKFEVTEGIQENIQETSAAAWRDFYAGQFFDTGETLSQAFGKGMSEQFTKQGLKTFLMGALTGSVIRIPTALAEKSLEAANTAVINRQYRNNPEMNPLTEARKQREADVAIVNKAMKDARGAKFAEAADPAMGHKLFNFNSQAEAALQQSEAAAKGLQYEFHNAKDNALLSAVAAAQRTNSIDALYRAVKDMGKDMTPEDFHKSFGVKLEDTKYRTASEFSETVAKDIKKYADTIDALRTKMKSKMADPSKYIAGSNSQYAASLLRIAQEDAIQILAMNAIKGDMAAKRAKQISEELLSVPGLSTSADYALRVLTNPNLLQGEIGTAFAEKKILEENLADQSLDADTRERVKAQLEAKVSEIILLQKWENYWERRNVVVSRDEEGGSVTESMVTDVFKGKTIKKTQTVKDAEGNEIAEVDTTYDPQDEEVLNTFRQILNVKNKQAGINTVVTEEAVRDGFQKIYDYIRLDTDTKDYMRSVDALMNPENFKLMLIKMRDGKFKANILLELEVVLAQSTQKAEVIIADLNITNLADKQAIYMKMADAVLENENYKKLSTLVSDPNTGIQNELYAAELSLALAKDIENAEAAIINQYSPTGANEDMDQMTYDEIIATKTLNTINRNIIAGKLNDKLELGPLEQKVYDIHKEEIDKLVKPQVEQIDSSVTTSTASPVNQYQDGQPAETETETITYIGEDGEITEPPAVEEVKAPIATAPAIEDASLGNPSSESAMLSQLLGLIPAEEETVENTQETPFAATGNPETGFDVVDTNNNPVNAEKFKSEEEALDVAESLNTTYDDHEFVRELLGPLADPAEEHLYIKMIEMGRKSMKGFNASKKASYISLREFYENKRGKQLLDAIKEAIITGNPVKYPKAKTTVAVTPEVQQVKLFETPSTGRAASLTLESLKDMHAKVVEFRQKALQNPDKFSKFVEKGNAAEQPVTKTSVLAKLQEITVCFS